jgi:acyl-CoA synthetase (NDP forming)
VGYAVVLKLERPVLAHKTEVGALRLALADAAQVREAAKALLALGRTLDATITPALLVEPGRRAALN